ncbi:MAG: lyase, partial [Nitrosopumilus sp.]
MLILIIFTIQNLIPSEMNVTLTGTPADNFSEEQRSKFCGTGNAKSNDYVKEYKIPTDCTLPQAIVADPDGNIWFVESNTGNLAKFDPSTKRFTEYDNPLWPQGERSMMWGIDYAPDETIWFTDEKYNSVWKFNIQDEKYQRFSFPSEENSYPQRLEIHGSKLIINDFKGNKIVFSDYARYGEVTSKFTSPDEKLYTYSLLSNNPDAVTADFTIEGENIWYTNWVLNGTGILAKVNQTEFELSIQNEEED